MQRRNDSKKSKSKNFGSWVCQLVIQFIVVFSLFLQDYISFIFSLVFFFFFLFFSLKLISCFLELNKGVKDKKEESRKLEILSFTDFGVIRINSPRIICLTSK